MKLKYIIIIILLITLGALYYGLSPLFIKKVVNEQAPIPSASEVLNTSSKALSAKVIDTKTHPASGEVRIVKNDAGTYIRYENFKTINGPDLFVYLANDLGAKDYTNLGELRATEGNINYKVPAEVDVIKYKYVMVWCKQFGVLFNYADISSIEQII